MKINVVKVLNILGTTLTVAGTIVTAIGGRKATDETIGLKLEEIVAKKMNK